MKPKVFVGSSVEGLSVAYSVQQNLMHDAEVTVWDQGVFELSATTIESLTKAISSTDFGVFVFSPDDTKRMRGSVASSVRDNVLFEFGLFIGKLGRERVFFLVPSKGGPKIPSDLLGITPAKYETDRSDGSLQAATGPACQQMRQQIKRVGPLAPPEESGSAQGESKLESEPREWFADFAENKFAEAKAKLEAALPEKDGEERLLDLTWIYYCDFKLEDKSGLSKLIEFASHEASAAVHHLTAIMLAREKEVDRAIQLLEGADPSIRSDPRVKTQLARLYLAIEDQDKAIGLLTANVGEPLVALTLAGIYENREDLPSGIAVIHESHIQNPRDADLRFKYARYAHELGMYEVAAYFLDGLTTENAESVEYWGYLGNACLALDLYDRALEAYRRAEALVDSSTTDDWIHANIGNLINNKDLPTEAGRYLTRALEIDPNSEYAHDRLAKALKKQADETKKYKEKLSEGRKKVRETEAQYLALRLAVSAEG